MNKRGISSVIGVSLIVLGAIIGTALLWAFVSRNIDNAKSEVTDPDCLTINLEVVSCDTFHACGYQAGWNYHEADLVVKRNVGRGNVTGLRFIFENRLGISGVADREINSNFGELGRVSFVEPYDGIPIPLNNDFLSPIPYVVKVAALIGEKKDVCPVASRFASCPVMSVPLPLGNISNHTYSGGTLAYNRRANNCCQHPINRSECYLGGDPNYPFNSQGILINVTTGLPSTILPPGNISICCQYDPTTGGPPIIIQ